LLEIEVDDTESSSFKTLSKDIVNNFNLMLRATVRWLYAVLPFGHIARESLFLMEDDTVTLLGLIKVKDILQNDSQIFIEDPLAIVRGSKSDYLEVLRKEADEILHKSIK
jgi:hypothetical protein